jgi:hypothetical protein
VNNGGCGVLPPIGQGLWATAPVREVTRTFPDPAAVTPDNLAPIGLPKAEATAIAALAGTLTCGGELNARSNEWRPWLALAAAQLMQTVLA